MNIRIFTALGLLALSGHAAAQGYFDFGQVPGVPEKPSVQVDLNSLMINFVREATRQADPAAAEFMAGLEGIRVRVYDELEDADAVSEYIDDTTGELERDGWQRMVFVDEDDEKVRIYVRFNEEKVDGMIVMVVEPGEAVFVNIAGTIDPTQLGQLASTIGMNGVFGLPGGIPSPDGTPDGSSAD